MLKAVLITLHQKNDLLKEIVGLLKQGKLDRGIVDVKPSFNGRF